MKSHVLKHGSRPRLKRTLSRGAKWEPVNEKDFPYFWAAYRLKSFPDTFSDKVLDQKEFVQHLDNIIANTQFAKTGYAKTRNGKFEPVGLVLGTVLKRPEWVGKPVLIPHVIWFSWAKPRNKIEAAISFFNEIRKYFFCLVECEPKNIPFFTHICKYGIMQRVGSLIGYYNNSSKTGLFQTRDR